MSKSFFTILLLLFTAGVATAQSEELIEYVQEGVELHDKGDYDGAIESFKKALKIDKKSPLANYEIANTYFAKKDYKNAIKHADKVIDEKGDYVDNAYIVKGSAQDLNGKPKDAIKTYRKGIADYPNNYLLHYNLALTSFNVEDYASAQEGSMGAIKVNPKHASSHYLLGLAMIMQGKRVHALFALYNFLMLEPNTSRSVKALQLLNDKLKQGVKKTGENSTTITISGLGDEEDEFAAAELMLSLLEAAKGIETNEGKTEQELFYNNTESFFKMIGELKKENTGFWWDFYVSYFNDMVQAKHVEAFSYYINQSAKNETVDKWLKDNKAKVDAFTAWNKHYDRVTGQE